VLVFVVGRSFSKAVAATGPASGLGAYLVGSLVWGIGLSLGGTTGYAINPARDLGPRIAHALLPVAGKTSSDWSYASIRSSAAARRRPRRGGAARIRRAMTRFAPHRRGCHRLRCGGLRRVDALTLAARNQHILVTVLFVFWVLAPFRRPRLADAKCPSGGRSSPERLFTG